MRILWRKYCLVIMSVIACGALNMNATAAELPDSLALNTTERQVTYFFLKGVEERLTGDPERAVKLFRKALSYDTLASAPLYELAKYKLTQNQVHGALLHLEHALIRDSLNTEYLELKANIHHQLNDLPKAQEAFEKLIKLKERDPELHYILADIYVKRGEIERAIEAYDKVEAETGIIEEISIYKARLYIELKENERAYDEIRRLMVDNPSKEDYEVLLGNVYLETEMPDSALAHYRKVLERNPKNAQAITSMINYYEKIGNSLVGAAYLRDALVNDLLAQENKSPMLSYYIDLQKKNGAPEQEVNDLIAQMITRDPSNTELRTIYAERLTNQGDRQEAKRQLATITALEPNTLNHWIERLKLELSSTTEYDNAHEICTNAIEHNPQSYELYYYLGTICMLRGREKEAIEALETGANLTPEDKSIVRSNFYGLLGDIYQGLKKREMAYRSYDMAIACYPDNYTAMNNYAYYLSLNNDDLNKAEYLSGRCIKLQPQEATYLDTYAWIYFKQRRYTLAKLYIENALSYGGDKQAEVVDHYGDILFHLGDEEKAIEQWVKALELQGGTSKQIKRKIKRGRYVK